MAFEPRPEYQDENPETTVVNVYPLASDPEVVSTEQDQSPNQCELDVDSWNAMTEFLIRRHEDVSMDVITSGVTVMRPRTETRWGFNRWAYLWPVQSPEGWRRATAAGFLAINALINIGNLETLAEDIGDEIAVGADYVEDLFSEDLVCGEPNKKAGKTETETKQSSTEVFVSSNASGEFTPSSNSVNQVLDLILSAQAQSRTIEVKISSVASDEWRALIEKEKGIGSPTQQNTDLAQQRAQAFTVAIIQGAEARGLSLNGVDFTLASSEKVLSEAEATELLDVIESFGLSVDDVIEAANQGLFDQIPSTIRDQLAELIASRGVLITVNTTEVTSSTAEKAPDDTEQNERNCNADSDPTDEDRDYNWGLIPFIWPAMPLFMRKQITSMVPEQYITEQLNPLDVLIHPDGADEQVRQMRENVWAYLRKYMHLLREDGRIQKVQELAYEDKNGDEQTLRVMYIDHLPTEETVDMVKDVLETATLITGGKLGQDVDIIAVYPRESAGRQYGSRRGRDIALGLDTQYEPNVTGVAYGNLGIVELHMDQVPTGKDLDQSFSSAKWTITHELLGHFTHLDPNVDQRELIEIGQSPDGRTLHATNNPLSETGLSEYSNLHRFAEIISRPGANLNALRWQVWLPGEDNPISVTGLDDPRLLEAERLVLEGVNPSLYGDSSHYEAWAEAAASHTTGIPVPFEQSAVAPVRELRRNRPDNGVGGTQVSQEWVRLLERIWGQLDDQQSESVRDSWRHTIGDPDEFEFMRELARFARETEVWSQVDPRWIRLVTGQLYNK